MNLHSALMWSAMAAGLSFPALQPSAAEKRIGRESEAASAFADNPKPALPLTTEQSAAAHIAAHHSLTVQVQAQMRDRAWAQKTEMTIATALGKPREGNAKIVHVDCRRNACLVSLEWQSFHAARDGWDTFLNAPLSIQCDREITLETPAEPNAPYQAQLVLTDCL
jgi:hypothetical protein